MQKVNNELEIDIDDKQLHKTWKIERIGWVFMLLFVLAGLSGLFGRGGFSNGKTGTPEEGIVVEYQRFLRYHTDDKMRVEIHSNSRETDLKILLGNEFNKKIKVEKVIPEPESMHIQKDGIEFTFKTSPGTSPKILYFYIKPQSTGNVNVSIGESGKKQSNFSQFIYP